MKINQTALFAALFASAVLASAFDVKQVVDAGETAPPADLSELSIPKTLGKIEERFIAPGSRWVLQIQDVHAHLTAQENIAAIVEHLSSGYGIATIALEGAWSSTSFPKSWGLPASREKQTLARALLEEDYITGPLHAALFSRMPVMLVGVEEEAVYEAGRKIFVAHLAARSEIEKKFAVHRNSLEREKEAVFNPSLLSFDRELSAFLDDEKGEKFIPRLFEHAKMAGVSFDDFPELARSKEAAELERSIDKPKLKAEAKRLMETFKEKRFGFEDLLLEGHVPQEKLGFYPATEKYLKWLRLREALDHRVFFSEVEKAVSRVKEKFLITPEERALDQKSARYFLAKKILFFKAAPEDLAKFESERETHRTELTQAGLGEALDLADKFYEAAAVRDGIFFKKITEDSRLAGNIALVTGGFHTPGLSRLLKEAGISYLVIAPSLGEKPGPVDEKIYFERLSEDSPGSGTFSELRDRANDQFDLAIAQGIRKRVTKEIPDLREAVRWIVNYQYRSSKPALLGKLAKGGEFMELPEEEQRDILKKLRQGEDPLGKTRAKKIRVTAIVRASTLQWLFEKDTFAADVWREELLAHKENTVVIVQDTKEVLTETIGGRAVIRRVTSDDLNNVIAKEKVRSGKSKIGVIDESAQTTEDVLVLPPHAASFFLLRPLAERGENWIRYKDPEVLSTLRNLLSQLYLEEGVKISA